MAHFNEILASRFTRGLNALLRVQELEGLRTLSPELQPVLEVESDREENAYLKAEQLWYHQAVTTAVVGERGMYLINNPLGSGVLVTVTMFGMSAAAAANSNWQGGTLASADIDVTLGTNTMGAHNARDRRASSPPLRVHFGEIVGLGLLNVAESIVVSVVSEMVYARALPVILPPGFAYGWSLNVTNMAARWCSAGRLRPLAPEEVSV